MISSETTIGATARSPAKAGLGAVRTSTGPALRRAAEIAALLMLMLMTIETADARQPELGRSSGPAASPDSRMVEQAFARAHPSARSNHRKMTRPSHGRIRAHMSKMRDNPAKTSAARKYDRPGSYFLHGARF